MSRCQLLAQGRHPNALVRCLLSGVKRTSRNPPIMSANDPKRTLSRSRYPQRVSWASMRLSKVLIRLILGEPC
jgi:hypothetical protein